MLYRILKIWAKAAFWVCITKCNFNNKEFLNAKGPLLLASNHPNSFLDAIILGLKFKRPLHFLARGDAFSRPLVKKILLKLNLIPIYRQSEGKEYIQFNKDTFEQCQYVLQNNGVLLIFAEGNCRNEWKLRSLKKGAARIAIQAWNTEGPSKKLKILPTGLNYSSFHGFPKKLRVSFGKYIKTEEMDFQQPFAIQIKQFNEMLEDQLRTLVIEEEEGRFPGFFGIQYFNNLKDAGYIKKKRLLNWVLLCFLSFPALIGWLLHVLFYFPLKKMINRKTAGTVFYDSVLFGVLMLLYPFYFFILNAFSYFFLPKTFLLVTLAAPVLGKIYTYCKSLKEDLKNLASY